MGGPISTRPSAFISSVERSPADPTGPRFRIENIYPCIQRGRYAVKRIAGEPVVAWADIFRDGEQRRLEWGGTRLRLNPAHDPALLFRCIT